MATENDAARAVHPYSMSSRRGGHSSVICKFWLAGRCNRNPCRFSHQSIPSPQYQSNNVFCGRGGPTRGKKQQLPKNVYKRKDSDLRNKIVSARSFTETEAGNKEQDIVNKHHGPNISTKNVSKEEMDSDQQSRITCASSCAKEEADDISSSVKHVQESRLPEEVNMKDIFEEDHVCAHWISGACFQAENCRFLHSWVSAKATTDIARIAELKEHEKAVTGIALPTGSNILFTGSIDRRLCAWDAHTGKCLDSINVEGEVGCVICESSWLFAGVPNAILAWNTETSQRLCLQGPVGQVHAMAVKHDTLFAACEDGDILAYKPCPEEMTFRLTATLKGHIKAVRSFGISKKYLYSGSDDCTIRCWDVDNFQCTNIMEGHSGAVTCLICWECYLFSGSLDKTFRVWAGTKDGGIQEVLSYYEEQGVTALMGMTDAAAKPVLFVSSNDNFVSMYEMDPEKAFVDRGRLFTKERVTTLTFCDQYLFTGDASGNVDVWKWLGQPCT